MRIIEERDEIVKDCPDCNSTLAITVKDIRDCITTYRVICPNCGGILNFTFSQLPSRWHKHLD